MKKIISICFLLFLISIKLNAQDRFKAGLKVGISTSQVSGDVYTGFHKAGFCGGATVSARINEKWHTQLELLFTQKGNKHFGNPKIGDYSFYLMQLNYIEAPLLVQYKQKKFTFEAGPGFGYLISGKEYDYYTEIQNALPFYKTEISANIGVSYTIYKNIGMSWRFTNSILPIRGYYSGASTWYNPGQRNNVITFTAIYKFKSAEPE
ncbi:MAG: porin family protein [Bacteroidia bacterium]